MLLASTPSLYFLQQGQAPPTIRRTSPCCREDHLHIVMIMFLMVLFTVAAIFGLVFCVVLGGIQASRVMHSTLLDRILHAPMHVFDTTPLGRILNRFSSDMDRIDSSIPTFSRHWLQELSSVIATLVIVCYSTPIFTAVLVPLLLFYYLIQVGRL